MARVPAVPHDWLHARHQNLHKAIAGLYLLHHGPRAMNDEEEEQQQQKKGRLHWKEISSHLAGVGVDIHREMLKRNKVRTRSASLPCCACACA